MYVNIANEPSWEVNKQRQHGVEIHFMPVVTNADGGEHHISVAAILTSSRSVSLVAPTHSLPASAQERLAVTLQTLDPRG